MFRRRRLHALLHRGARGERVRGVRECVVVIKVRRAAAAAAGHVLFGVVEGCQAQLALLFGGLFVFERVPAGEELGWGGGPRAGGEAAEEGHDVRDLVGG